MSASFADDFGDVDFGMHTAAGNAALADTCATVAAVLAAGLGRDVALRTLHGSLFALDLAGHREYSDTVVRETITAILEPVCEDAGVPAFTDEDVNALEMHTSQRALSAHVTGWCKGATETAKARPHRQGTSGPQSTPQLAVTPVGPGQWQLTPHAIPGFTLTSTTAPGPVAVSEVTKDGTRTGLAHRPASGKAKTGPRRNRSQYRASCGELIGAGHAFHLEDTTRGVCRTCFPSHGS